MSPEGFKRKLTAILSADVVGYSRLMGEDDDATVRTLTVSLLVRLDICGRIRVWSTVYKFFVGR